MKIPINPTCSIDLDGNKRWKLQGDLHRDDGPAAIYTNGMEIWYRYGIYHRVGGPAIIRPDLGEYWYQYGARHREDGPAIMFANGRNEWWFLGVRIHNKREYQSATGITNEQMTMLILKYGDIK